MTSLQPTCYIAEWFRFFLCNSRKWVPSGSGDFLRLLVGEMWTPKLAQIFAYGKWLYPYRMLLHGASDLDQRCLKTRRSAVVAFLGNYHQMYCPYPQNCPQNPILRTFQCKPITDRTLRISGTLMELRTVRSWNFTVIGIDKYSSACKNVSARWRPGGAGPPNVHLGPP